jgi:hypothetical protein
MVGSRASVLGLVASLLGVAAGSAVDRAAAITPSRAPVLPASSDIGSGLLPEGVSPDDAVTERELAGVATRLGREIGSRTEHPITVLDPSAPVTRLRVIAALVKLAGADDRLPGAEAESERMPPDAALLPAWGARFVARAVEEGWWLSDQPLRPRAVASWDFVKTLLQRFMGSTTPDVLWPGTERRSSPAETDPVYTGLVLDARGLDLQRAMGPRILDEDGEVLYPDPNHVPDMVFLQDHGMAAYVTDGQEPIRSGDRPLTVWVVRVSGAGHDDLVVSRRTAQRIRDAAARDGFLSRWAVSILISAR